MLAYKDNLPFHETYKLCPHDVLVLFNESTCVWVLYCMMKDKLSQRSGFVLNHKTLQYTV